MPPRPKAIRDVEPTDAHADAGRPAARRNLPSAGDFMTTGDRAAGWDAYLADLLAAVLVWGAIGWLLDHWLGTAPWLMIVGVMLGHAFGLYLLWLRSTPPDRTQNADGQDGASDA